MPMLKQYTLEQERAIQRRNEELDYEQEVRDIGEVGSNVDWLRKRYPGNRFAQHLLDEVIK